MDIDPLELLFHEITDGPNGVDLNDFLLFLRRKAAADQLLQATLRTGESLLNLQNLERESGLSPALNESLNPTIERAGVILKAIIREMDEDPSSEEEGDDDNDSNTMSVDLERSSASEANEESDEEEEEEPGAMSAIFGHETRANDISPEDQYLRVGNYLTTRSADEEPEYGTILPVSRPQPYPCERMDNMRRILRVIIWTMAYHPGYHGNWEAATATLVHPQHYPLPPGNFTWRNFVVYSVSEQRWRRIGEGLSLVGRSSVLLVCHLTLPERECPGLAGWRYLVDQGTSFLDSDDEDMEEEDELQSDAEPVAMTAVAGVPGSSFNNPLIIN
ncbi:hypothetical protein C8F04DRAFT_1267188 [Mycena alexandri]|uniref:Uncharacterized protein n=1 Tax=Mycena alexandri TaxID=1745969 RepID=A0AAD6WVY5_9AGAR|nr:hypothetical protein C8F04DRAFT_1267188 [Mycena alexandri]